MAAVTAAVVVKMTIPTAAVKKTPLPPAAV
jgi:hypothetical protein